MAQERLAEGGFSCSDFPGDFNEALALADAIDHMRERFAVLLGEVQEGRVRGDRKRFFSQAEKLKIHPPVARAAIVAYTVATCKRNGSLVGPVLDTDAFWC